MITLRPLLFGFIKKFANIIIFFLLKNKFGFEYKASKNKEESSREILKKGNLR